MHVPPKSKIQARGTCWLRARARSGKMQTPPGIQDCVRFSNISFYTFLHYMFFSFQKTKNKDAGVQNITNNYCQKMRLQTHLGSQELRRPFTFGLLWKPLLVRLWSFCAVIRGGQRESKGLMNGRSGIGEDVG